MKIAIGTFHILFGSIATAASAMQRPDSVDDYHFFQLQQDFYTFEKKVYNEDYFCTPDETKSCTKFCIGLNDDNGGRCDPEIQYCNHNKLFIEPCDVTDLTQRFYFDGEHLFPLNTINNDPHLSYTKADLVAAVPRIRRKQSIKLRPYKNNIKYKWSFTPGNDGYGEIKTRGDDENGDKLCVTFRGPHLELDDWLRLDYEDCDGTARQLWTELDTATLCDTLCSGESCTGIDGCYS